MLESELPSEEEAAKQGNLQKGTGDKMPPTSHTLIDLLIAMSIYLPRSSFGKLFALAAVVINRQASDPQLIKKAYKLIPRLATTEIGRAALSERSSELQALVLATVDKTPSPARRDRGLAIHELITYLPTSDLHFIPSVLSEVVLGCKESNEKARTACFDLLVHMAKRITDPERNPPGTKIRNSLVPHMPDDSPDAPATLEEFFTMVSAGLAGSSPHMVAASVTALSRLFFEFYSQLSSAVVVDLTQTVELFLTSNNREIVRSVLGFVKVAVVVLPEDVLRPRLDSLVPNLMVWSKEHNGRLRTKVKGILDRLVRRFGAQTVEALVGEEDRKIVVNIRKARERSKRKKKEGQEGGEGEDEDKGAGRKTFANEFDKAVYGSDLSSDESDLDDASEIDVDEKGHVRSSSKKKGGKAGKGKAGKEGEQYIRELSPESNPLDLLAPDALASISTTKPNVRFLNTGPGAKKKRSARVDLDGKLIFGGKDADADADVDMTGGAADGAGVEPGSGINAYLAAVSGPNAVRRGQKGRLKFSNKRNKDGDGMDVDDDDEEGGAAAGNASAGAGATTKRNIASGRRGLGVPKSRGPSGPGRIEKHRGGRGSGFAAGGKRSGRGSIRVGGGRR
jgi:ribosomal RNA-processing protein 12